MGLFDKNYHRFEGPFRRKTANVRLNIWDGGTIERHKSLFGGNYHVHKTIFGEVKKVERKWWD